MLVAGRWPSAVSFATFQQSSFLSRPSFFFQSFSVPSCGCQDFPLFFSIHFKEMICSIDSLLPRNPKCLIFNVDQQPIVVMLKRILFLHLTMRERSSEFCPSIETLLTNECVYCPIYDLDAELRGKNVNSTQLSTSCPLVAWWCYSAAFSRWVSLVKCYPVLVFLPNKTHPTTSFSQILLL